METTNFLQRYAERISQRLSRHIDEAIESGHVVETFTKMLFIIDGLCIHAANSEEDDFDGTVILRIKSEAFAKLTSKTRAELEAEKTELEARIKIIENQLKQEEK